MTIHELKTWPDVFREIVLGNKVHEFRRNDRGFQLGDELRLREFFPVGERYTGNEVKARITCISRGPEWGIPKGFAAMSIRVLSIQGVDLERGPS